VKKLKIKEINEKLRNMTNLELMEKLKDSKEELFNLRFQMATGHLTNNARVNTVRKQIARIYTILKEKELKG
jgi:large subunit ribosomal protein L29